jgi:hypothetical protein
VCEEREGERERGHVTHNMRYAKTSDGRWCSQKVTFFFSFFWKFKHIKKFFQEKGKKKIFVCEEREGERERSYVVHNVRCTSETM